MKRLVGWEKRLEEVFREAQGWTYELGERDCFRFTCRAVEALTGVDRWPEFAGCYRTRRQALRLLARYAGHQSPVTSHQSLNFEAAGDWFFASERISPRMARRGDAVALKDPANDERHLGIVRDHRILFMLDTGLAPLPVSCPDLVCAWGIGW